MYNDIVTYIYNQMELNKIFKENAYTRGFQSALDLVLNFVQKKKMEYDHEH